MSFILDALKRAEADRSRGAIPTLHAQPLAGGAHDPSGLSAKQLAAWCAGALAVLVAAVVWWTRVDDAPAPVQVSQSAPAAAQPQPAATRGAPPVGTAPVNAPVSLLPAATESQPRLSRLPPASAYPPDTGWARPAPPAMPSQPLPKPAAPIALSPATRAFPAAPVAKRAPPAAAPSGVAGTTTAAAATAATAPATESTNAASVGAGAAPGAGSPAAADDDRIYAFKDLPDDLRNSLPTLTVGGATYSENAASRMLIINGRLFHEGEKLTPELTLQHIKLRSAVLSFRGVRYSISY
jgi:general secretion pathway protein B